MDTERRRRQPKRARGSRQQRPDSGATREVLGLEDFTEADVEIIRNSEPPAEAAAFDHEVTG